MADLEIPNDIVAGTEIVAGEMQANFDAIESFVNGSVSHRDGSTPYTVLPSAPTEDPSTDGHLVTKAALDRRAGVLAKRTHTSESGYLTYDIADQDVGISAPAFTMPTLSGGRGVKLELYVPQTTMESHGGFPVAGALIEARLKHGTATVVYASGLVGTLGGLGPTGVPSIYGVNYLFDNTVITAGATVTLSLSGHITGPSGKAKFIGSAGAAILIVATKV